MRPRAKNLLGAMRWPEGSTFDDRTPQCFPIFRFFIEYFFGRVPAFTTLPPKLEKRALNDISKAARRGVVMQQCFDPKDIGPKLISILDSTTARQGKPTNYQAFDLVEKKFKDVRISGWPREDYHVYTCPNHKAEIWEAVKDNLPIGLIETVTVGDNVLVTLASGHKDYFKDGIMNLMFYHAMQAASGRKRFFFGNDELKAGSMGLFMRGLGINQGMDLYADVAIHKRNSELLQPGETTPASP